MFFFFTVLYICTTYMFFCFINIKFTSLVLVSVRFGHTLIIENSSHLERILRGYLQVKYSKKYRKTDVNR